MKTRNVFFAATLSTAVILASGCGNKEQASPGQTEPKPGSAISQEGQKAMDAAKSAAAEAQAKAAAAKAAVEKTAAEAQTAAQGLIDSAKKSLADGKLTEVQGALSQIKDLKLTPEQQQSLADLKTKLEAMLKDAMGKNPGASLPGGLVPNK